ncbi:MAG: ATP-dependent DNA helicase [bacterium]|nr:ATP-dependent DNA helicase [bacterium]
MTHELHDNLNTEQKTAVTHLTGPLLIVAGAGTGKTTVIAEKIAYLIKSSVAKPEEILALSFNDKAAAEIQDRTDGLIDLGYADIQISTFHTFCQSLLERYGLEFGLPNQFKQINETDAWLLVRKNLAKFNLDIYRPLGNPIKHIHELLKHFSKCKDELISPADYLRHAEEVTLNQDGSPVDSDEVVRLKEISGAYQQYNQLLLDNTALDFGDLIFYAVKLLEARPQVLNKIRARFKYILVDEFQDVNWAQYWLVRQIAGTNANLTVVGDDDQSIYAFRGASVSNILRFKEDFPTAKEVVLKDNYRSGQGILDIAYKSIQNNNPDRLEEKLKIDKKLISKVDPRPAPEVVRIHTNTLDEEAAAVAAEIIKIKQADPDITWDDFAILIRANNHADPFIFQLSKQGIPCEFLSAAGLYRQPVVIDCVNYLRAVMNSHNSPAIYRLLCLPFLKLQETELHKLLTEADKKSAPYFERLKNLPAEMPSETAEAIKKIVACIEEGMKPARLAKPTTVLYKFLNDSGYLSYLAKGEDEGDRAITRQIFHLQQFFKYLSEFETANPEAKIYDFLEHYDYILESGDRGKNNQPTDSPDSVNILTVHTAKGLEYSYVFVVNMVEERFPSRSHGDGIEIPPALIHEQLPSGDAHYQEERRLFYVAITRAKNKLFLTSAEDYGGARKKKISRFIKEIYPDEVETSAKAEKKYPPKADSPLARKLLPEQMPEITPVESKLHAVKAFSFSQLKSYETCPYQYKLQYVLGMPSSGTGSLSFGNSVHATLHEFYSKVIELNNAEQASLFGADPTQAPLDSASILVPTVDDLLTMYAKNWIPDWYESAVLRETFYKKGEQILRQFYKMQDGKWSIPVALESPFKIKVGDYIVRGKIDRIDRTPDKTLTIIDYKTGQPKAKVEAGDKDQLLLYQLALEVLPEYNQLGAVKSLTYLYLTNGGEISFIGAEKDKNKLIQKISDIGDKINAGEFKATPEKFACSHCNFRDICNYRV